MLSLVASRDKRHEVWKIMLKILIIISAFVLLSGIAATHYSVRISVLNPNDTKFGCFLNGIIIRFFLVF